MKKIVLVCFLSVFLFSCSEKKENRIASGYLEAEERIISAELPGKLIALSVEEGDKLILEEVIGIQDTTELFLTEQKLLATMQALRQKLSSADAQVAVLLERKDHIENELERVEKLLESEAVPLKQKDDLLAELSVVKKQIESVKSTMSTANRSILSELLPMDAQLKIIRRQKEKAFLKSPLQGTVIQVFTHEGEFAMPGKPILKLADLSNMEFKMYLTAAQLSEMKLGQDVWITPAGFSDSVKIKGNLFWISAEAEFTPKNILAADEKAQLVYAAKARFRNDGSLKIGMPADYVRPD